MLLLNARVAITVLFFGLRSLPALMLVSKGASFREQSKFSSDAVPSRAGLSCRRFFHRRRLWLEF